jgi:hypothetical protein
MFQTMIHLLHHIAQGTYENWEPAWASGERSGGFGSPCRAHTGDPSVLLLLGSPHLGAEHCMTWC